MSHPAAPKTLEALRDFRFGRILNEDILTHSITFLGSLPEPESDGQVQAIIRIEKTVFDPAQVPSIFHSLGGIERAQTEQSTDIVRVLYRDHGRRHDDRLLMLVYLDVWLVGSWERTRCEDQHRLPSNRSTYQEGEDWLSRVRPIHLLPLRSIRNNNS
jgi:hypothetical protein